MSFSSEVKKELCSVNAVDTEQKKAELYGLLIFSKVFKKDKIVLTTENSDVSKKVTDLLEELYMPIIEKETTLCVRNEKISLKTYFTKTKGLDICLSDLFPIFHL